MMSIKTIDTSGVVSKVRIASFPVLAVNTFIPRRSRTLLSAKILRTSSSTTRTALPNRSSSERWRRSSMRCFTRVGDDHLEVLMPEELAYAHLLGGIVLDDEQAFASRRRIRLDLLDRGIQSLRRRRFGDEGEGAPRQAVLSILVERHDL